MTRLPILTFHSVDGSGSVISMPAPDVARILRQLADAGWRGCSVSEALAARRLGPGGDRVFGLSFDDGYRNVRGVALPVLRELGFTATVFVIAGRAGGDNRWPGQPSSVPVMPLLDWPDMASLVEAGWEVGAHGLDHLPLTAIGSGPATRELEGGKQLIEDTLGVPVPLFAYPYGAFDRAILERTRAAYQGACSAKLALASDADVRDGFAVPRLDAYYLRSVSPRIVCETLLGRGYVALRRWARLLRRPPWDRNALRDYTGGNGRRAEGRR